MRIGFDVSPLHRPHPPGIVRVVGECVAALERRGHLEVVRLAPAAGEGLRAWRQRELPRRARELAGIHSFLSAFPVLGPGRRVQTIHELPWLHGERENAGLAHRLWSALGPLRADAVVTATEASARDIRLRRLPGRRKVRVIPWGVSERFRPGPRTAVGPAPLLFCPGAAREKKGLEPALRGAASHAARPRIVVTGPTTDFFRRQHAEAQALGVALFNAEELAEAQLVELYQDALAVVLLSRSEGFGLPVLEAMACGTPVIVPRGSAQAEVAGAAGLRVDPDDPESLAQAIERALREREALRALGLERAAQFTWERTAEALERLWEELA